MFAILIYFFRFFSFVLYLNYKGKWKILDVEMWDI